MKNPPCTKNFDDRIDDVHVLNPLLKPKCDVEVSDWRKPLRRVEQPKRDSTCS